jgi:hypothetical protein
MDLFPSSLTPALQLFTPLMIERKYPICYLPSKTILLYDAAIDLFYIIITKPVSDITLKKCTTIPRTRKKIC